MLNEETDAIKVAQLGMKPPVVTDKKILWFVPTDGKKVEYTSSSVALEDACSASDGVLVKKDFSLSCTSSNRETASLEVVDYPLCMAPLCKFDLVAQEETIYLQSQHQMRTGMGKVLDFGK